VVYYYSATNKTKIYANLLANLLDCPAYELKAEMEESSEAKLLFKVLWTMIRKKDIKVTNMPDSFDKEIYLCGPVWAGSPALPILYLLKTADLKGVTVNMLLTAGAVSEKIAQKAIGRISSAGCVPGKVHVFVGSDDTEREVAEEHIRKLYLDED
jgi:hypothetical protein